MPFPKPNIGQCVIWYMTQYQNRTQGINLWNSALFLTLWIFRTLCGPRKHHLPSSATSIWLSKIYIDVRQLSHACQTFTMPRSTLHIHFFKYFRIVHFKGEIFQTFIKHSQSTLLLYHSHRLWAHYLMSMSFSLLPFYSLSTIILTSNGGFREKASWFVMSLKP